MRRRTVVFQATLGGTPAEFFAAPHAPREYHMTQRLARVLPVIVLGFVLGCAQLTSASRGSGQRMSAADYLYVWTGDRDTLHSDFLAVLDVRPGSPNYARVLATVSVEARNTGPHHTEHQVEADGLLFANGFNAGRTFRFDLADPAAPRLIGQFGEVGEFSFPHSFVQLKNGNMLSTFQGRGAGRTPPGGLVELDRQGRLVRATSARAVGFDSLQLRPYSLTVLPAIDRVVSTSTDMILDFGANVQVWRLSDLALLSTTALPPAADTGSHPHPADSTRRMVEHHLLPGEPRVLRDGRTVLLATFTCGFYRVTNLQTLKPTVEFLRAFRGKNCAVPVLAGDYWVQSVPDEHALVALDISDSRSPREVSRVTFDSTFRPHWLAFDDVGSRLVVNDQIQRLLLVHLDQRTGALAIDTRFRDEGATEPGVSFSRPTWPHGATGHAIPHGSVFSPKK